jgi:TonB-dependent starch-binding outer membrane protein SusC
MHNSRRRTLLATLIGGLALAAPPESGAQQVTGTLRGKVTNAASTTPIANAQVFVAGTSLGTMTAADGNYQINLVPAGTHTVRVRMIGYQPTEKSVAVTASSAATLDFTLTSSAISLDEVVVTGTAGSARKREVGNSIASVRVSEIPEAPNNLSSLIAGRMAGVNVSNAGGGSGAGSSIRLRGLTSVALSNQPLLYIDGVRVRSDEYPKNVPASGGNELRSSHVVASPLNDINPDDIERIEVVKGAAAATLYGTDAAAGVIQIFTKRGQQGKPQWTLGLNQGFNQLRKFGTDSVPYLNLDPWLRKGYRQEYSASVAGGTSTGLKYFVSGLFDSNEGVLPNDKENKNVVRGNFGFTPTPKLNVEWNSSYTKDFLSQTPAGNNAHGLTLNAFRQERNYFGNAHPDTISQVLGFQIDSDIDRLTLGGTATYTPTTWWSNRVTVGVDRAAVENRNLRPFGFRGAPQGIISDQRWSNLTYTVDYVGNVDNMFGESLKSTFSWGTQYVRSAVSDISAYSENFPGPGVPTVSTGSLKSGFENRQTIVTAGAFLQELIGFKDKYFLTIGGRIDGNSAFGEDFGLQFYPKVSGSWVVSDESFWNLRLGTLKLRAAYGSAGRAPGAFDAVQTWGTPGWGGSPAFRPLNIGNPNLGPERTNELELGFDATAFDGRLTGEVTYFDATTKDALLNVRLIPSQGFGANLNGGTGAPTGSQLQNVGTLSKSGFEVAVNSQLIDRPRFGWNVGATLSTNKSKADDLGGATSFSIGNFGWVIEGETVPVVRAKLIRNADTPGAAIDTTSNHLFGPSQPTRIIGVNSSIRVWRGIELSARGEYQGGHFIDEDASFQALSRGVRWPTCANAYKLIAASQQANLTPRERLTCIQANVRNDMFIFPADFFKVRDVTLRVPLGKAIPRTNSSTLIVSAGNWFRWTKGLPLFDPEMNSNAGFNEAVRAIQEQIPSAATFLAQLRITF